MFSRVVTYFRKSRLILYKLRKFEACWKAAEGLYMELGEKAAGYAEDLDC